MQDHPMTPAESALISRIAAPERGLLRRMAIAERGTDEFATCRALTAKGVMRQLGTPDFLSPQSVVFFLTQEPD